VGVIDVAQQRVTRSFAVAGDPYMILLNPDGSLLYVTQPGAGRVTALATKTGQVICDMTFSGHPALLALSVDGTELYVAGLNEMVISVLNAQTCALERSFDAPEPVSWLVATGSNGPVNDTLHTQLWVAGNASVSILDEQGHLQDTIVVPGGPRFLSLPGGLTAYVATRQGSVLAIDMLARRIIAPLISGGAFGSMDYNAITGEIYVPDQRRDQVDVLTPVLGGSGVMPREPAQVIHVHGSPQAVAITNDGQLGFVALSGGQVEMLDIPGRSIARTISVGGTPRFIITGAYPPAIVPTPHLSSPSSPNTILLGLSVVLLIALLCGAFWLFWRHRKTRFFL
jgi:DNA-binding beta-propeller fold protein YncE